MPRLCLVRHTTPVVDPARPAEEWDVDDSGRMQVLELLPTLGEVSATVIVTSPEPKARITAEILAQGTGLDLYEAEGLREQGLGEVPWFDSVDAFNDAVRNHFAQPDAAVLGAESSRAAARRFDAVVRHYTAVGVPVLVSHGRIMAGWLASQVALDAWEAWQNLRMPDALLVEID